MSGGSEDTNKSWLSATFSCWMKAGLCVAERNIVVCKQCAKHLFGVFSLLKAKEET